LDERRKTKDAAAAEKTTRAPRGVPNLPDPRPFVTNAPRDLDRPTVGRRDELALLDDLLLAPAGAAAVTPAASMTAHGGMGKTTLALTYAALQRHRTRFEGVWLVRAEDEQTLLSDIEMLGLELGQTRPQGVKPQDWAQHVWRQVAKSPYPWLILFDNAPDFISVRAHLPSGDRFRLIVTSREENWPKNRFHPLEVPPLPIPEAADMLEHEADRKDDRPGAEALADVLDGFPLSLVLAGGYARDAQLSFADCGARIADLMTRAAPSDYPHKLGAVLDLTLARIALDAQTGPDELALLALLPWLAPEGMDAKLVLDVKGTTVGTDITGDIPTAIRALATDAARLQAAIGALARRSLAVADGGGPTRTVALHRITAQILRARDGVQADARRRAAAAVVAASYPGIVADHRNWPACRRLNPHVAALFAPANAGGAEAPDPPASAAMEFLLNQASAFHKQHAAAEVALAYARAALDLQIARLGPDDPSVGIGHDNLGGALGAAGAWSEAVTERRKALRISEAQGANYPLLGKRLSNLASAMKGEATATFSGDARRARLLEVAALGRRAYKVDRRLPDAPNERTAMRLSNHAYTFDLLGDRRRAQRIGALALATWRKVLVAPGDPRLATSLSNLGGYHMKDRAPDRALPLLTEALAIRAAAFAADHPRCVTTARWLARCHLAQQAPDVAGAAALCKTYGLDFDEINRDAAQCRPLS
jgi:tetratricopeptide (TPR) repeat protein